MSAYYNENDPNAAAWLRNLISAGLIAPGVVDERSIVDVQPSDLEGFTQCHFFAGIAGWSCALRLADWPDDRPVWTGSCPCQPWSQAGRGKGAEDDRHLWPHFARLIDAHRPAVIFGEQVASAAGRMWLSRVRVDLETMGYGVGCADLCAASIGAPQLRQRLWWVADAERNAGGARRLAGESGEGARTQTAGTSVESGRCGSAGGVADSDGGLAWHGELQPGGQHGQQQENSSAGGGVANADRQRRAGQHALLRPEENGRNGARAVSEVAGRSAGSFWGDAVWIPCADGKARRIKPGLEPLANGVSGRVAALRGYGNAIVPQVAEAFIRAYNEI